MLSSLQYQTVPGLKRKDNIVDGGLTAPSLQVSSIERRSVEFPKRERSDERQAAAEILRRESMQALKASVLTRPV
jgi:hypothetical protein